MTITTERCNEIYENPEQCSYSEIQEIAAMLGERLASREAVAGERGASLQLRGLIRQKHAKWSEETFGNVGPVGPLKHLSKEALEAAAEPDDLSEWADIQFLMWDAQRRAGISDAEITAAMEEKLKVNMARQWPEPKDGEPRLHITAPPAPAVPDECPAEIRDLMASHSDALFNDDDAQQIWNACRAAMLAAAPKVKGG